MILPFTLLREAWSWIFLGGADLAQFGVVHNTKINKL